MANHVTAFRIGIINAIECGQDFVLQPHEQGFRRFGVQVLFLSKSIWALCPVFHVEMTARGVADGGAQVCGLIAFRREPDQTSASSA